MTQALFIRLLEEDEKSTALAAAIRESRESAGADATYAIDPSEFRRLPGSPLAYWASERVRSAFTSLPPFERGDRRARVGLHSSDDFRFIRTWWEVRPSAVELNGQGEGPAELRHRESTRKGRKWVPVAKGGAHSRFYTDVSMSINWESDGAEIKAWAGSLYNGSHWSRLIQSADYYFRPGFTWPLRGIRLSVQCLPVGSVFTVAGKAAFSEARELPSLLAILNSKVFDYLLCLFAGKVGGVQYESGLIGRVPVPDLSEGDRERLTELASSCVQLKRDDDQANETSHVFTLPAVLSGGPLPLVDALARWRREQDRRFEALGRCENEIDAIVLGLYGLSESDILTAATLTSPDEDTQLDGDSPPDDESEDAEEIPEFAARPTSAALVSWVIGCAFGRFDVRSGLIPSLMPALQGSFEPLPPSSPGMLVGPNGLPATRNSIVSEDWLRARPNAITLPPAGAVARQTILDSEYPIAVDWDGILVDDPEHEDDVVRRVREVLDVIWDDGAEGIEREACEMLGVRELRDWFRNPRNFWDDHVKRYSKSRRKAPIYWLLQSAKRSYGLWLYSHRLDSDLYAKALVNYVEPKVRHQETRLKELRSAFQAQQPSGAAARKAEREIERQEALISELEDFRASLDKVVKLGLQPDLDDGVVLNIAPLHELVPWKVARQYWDELLAGKYEWSAISKQLRAKGLVH